MRMEILTDWNHCADTDALHRVQHVLEYWNGHLGWRCRLPMIHVVYEVECKTPCNWVHIRKPTEYKSLCYDVWKPKLLVYELQLSSADGFLLPSPCLPTWKHTTTPIFITYHVCLNQHTRYWVLLRHTSSRTFVLFIATPPPTPLKWCHPTPSPPTIALKWCHPTPSATVSFCVTDTLYCSVS